MEGILVGRRGVSGGGKEQREYGKEEVKSRGGMAGRGVKSRGGMAGRR